MFALVVILTLILLARAFRSIVLAFKAALLNLVSLAAAFGVAVFVFQQGHGSQLWDIDATQSDHPRRHGHPRLLVPALMRLLGNANWWMPNWARIALRVPHRTPVPEVAAESA